MASPDDSGPHPPNLTTGPGVLFPQASSRHVNRAAYPSEPAEDSAADPVPENPGGTETDKQLKEEVAAEAAGLAHALERHLPVDTRAYRGARLGDRSIMPRLRRRYARVFSEEHESDVLDDLVQDTMTFALQRGDFPSPDETMFPWIYKPGEAKRKQAIRRRQRARTREVELNESVDAHASVPPPDQDLPQGLQEKALVLAEAVAKNPRKRRTLGQIAMHVIMGESWDSIAATEGTTTDAAKQDASRFQREMRVLVRATSAIALCLCIGYVARHPAGVAETISSWIHPRTPVDPVPKDLPPGPRGDRDLLDDAEQALKEGNFERCTADAQNARFHGADPVRLGDITRRCQELGDRNAPAPSAIASSSPTPAPKGPAPKVPAPVPQRPVAPEQMRTLQPLK